MSRAFFEKDTIIAIATPLGYAGVGVIRISGPKAYDIGKTISKKTHLTHRLALYTPFYLQDKLIDEGLILFFKKPYSFTGEDVVELQGHANPVLQEALLDYAFQLGARLAKPGEFLETAFLNGKCDLTKAEAVADLISANSKASAYAASQSMQGVFSQKIHQLQALILNLRTQIEAYIDFADDVEDSGFLMRLEASLHDAIHDTIQLSEQCVQNKLLHQGATVVLAGLPNSGKSSLFNALTQEDTAIVTPIPGTTRDMLKSTISIDDFIIYLIDTAGMHETSDIIEQEGIYRTKKAIQFADYVLWIIDVQMNVKEVYNQLMKACACTIPHSIVVNKIDLKAWNDQSLAVPVWPTSVPTQVGLEELKTNLKKIFYAKPIESLFSARERHIRLIHAVIEELKKAQNCQNILFIAEHCRLSIQYLSQLTGEDGDEALLNSIFSTFCIGK